LCPFKVLSQEPRYAIPTFETHVSKRRWIVSRGQRRPTQIKDRYISQTSWMMCSRLASPEYPIENLWAEVKRNLHNRKKKPTNLLQLNHYVKDVESNSKKHNRKFS